MREDPPLSLSESRCRAKKYAVHDGSQHTTWAIVSEPQLQSQPTPSTTTFMPHYEELLCQVVSSIASLQEREKNCTTTSTAAPDRCKPGPRDPALNRDPASVRVTGTQNLKWRSQ